MGGGGWGGGPTGVGPAEDVLIPLTWKNSPSRLPHSMQRVTHSPEKIPPKSVTPPVLKFFTFPSDCKANAETSHPT